MYLFYNQKKTFFKKGTKEANKSPLVPFLWGRNKSLPIVDCNFHVTYTGDLNNENNKTQNGSKVKMDTSMKNLMTHLVLQTIDKGSSFQCFVKKEKTMKAAYNSVSKKKSKPL